MRTPNGEVPIDLEDATQDSLVRILTNLGSFRGEGSFETWAYRIVCSTLLTLRKKRMETHVQIAEE